MIHPYIRLLRLDKPAGIALLWAPTACALWLANQGHPTLKWIALFLLGTLLMRPAGCIINDLTDRNIDKYVKRTALRPLATGEISVEQALLVLGLLLLFAFLILVQLPRLCWYQALFAMGITIIYPLGKRFLHAPQLLLGIAFSMGIPMAYATASILINLEMCILLILNFLWIVAYDTIYALADREDDLLIGAHSTAILFGSKVIPIVLFLLGIVHSLWLILGLYDSLSWWFWGCWIGGLVILHQQYQLLSVQSPANATRAFLWNTAYGLIMWIAVLK